MLFKHGRRLFKVKKQIRNTSILFFFITLVEGILWYFLPIYFNAQFNSIFLVGVLISAYSVASVLTDLPAGDLSDHLGRKFTFILGLIGAVLAMVLLLFGNFQVLLLAMILYGAFSTFYYTSSSAHILDHSTEKEVGRNSGIFTMCADAGWTVGPLLAGVALYYLDAPKILALSIIMFLLFILAGHRFLSGSDRFTLSKFKKAEKILKKDKVYLYELKRLMKIGKPLLYIFFFSFAVGVWELVIWTLEPLYVSLNGYNLILGGLALGVLTAPYLFFDYLSGWLCDKKGVKASVMLGLAIVIVGHLVIFTQDSLVVLFLALLFSVIGVAFMWIPVNVMIRQKVERGLRAEAIGFSDTAYGVGGIFAPLLVGSIASIDNFVIPFYFTFILFIIAGLVFHFAVKH